METVAPYRTRLEPPPADGAGAHEGRAGDKYTYIGGEI
jgi:hypothetical protein